MFRPSPPLHRHHPILRQIHVVSGAFDYDGVAMVDFMLGHLNDSLDEIAPELRVSPNFITFCTCF